MEETARLLQLICMQEKYQATLVSVSTIIGIPGLQHAIPYHPDKVEEMADKLIELGIENFKKRKGKIVAKVPKITQKAIAGFRQKQSLKP